MPASRPITQQLASLAELEGKTGGSYQDGGKVMFALTLTVVEQKEH